MGLYFENLPGLDACFSPSKPEKPIVFSIFEDEPL